MKALILYDGALSTAPTLAPGNVGTERIAAFSDGVIAIIITIMVLELKLSDDAAKG